MEKFVESGGTLIVTYWSGIVDENDLCFLGGFPGPLRKVTGIRSEEIDALYDEDYNYAVFDKDNPLKLEKEYKTVELCDLIHAETAKVLATYKEDFYAGRPALTVNEFGKGKCYYIAFRSGDDFLSDFYGRLIEDLDIQRVLDIDLPEGVTAQKRSDGDNDFIFVMNFAGDQRTVDLGDEELTDMIDGPVKEKSHYQLIVKNFKKTCQWSKDIQQQNE